MLSALLLAWLALPQQRPIVPVMITGSDLDPCSAAVVTGLKPGGDGFLAVRTGPGTNHKELARLHNGAVVYTCASKGDWIGIVWSGSTSDCNVGSPWPRTLPYTGPCRSGWVHGKWIEVVAG